MRTLRLLLLLCLLLPALAARGQVRLSGRVTDGAGQALPSAVVKVYEEGGKDIIAYRLSDREGRYAMDVKSQAQQLRLECALLGYKAAERTVRNAPGTYNFTLTETAIDIREVTVKAPPVNTLGDTLIYNVGAMQQASDRTIEDVIRRIPGVSIDEAGGIQYKGEDINRFYIEDLDMLGGRYTLATQNIRPEDVLSVDVYENHQPKKVLKDLGFSKHAALNLKLKKRSLGRPVGDVTAGAGWGDGATWSARLYALFVGRNRQHLLTAGGNNFAANYTGSRSLLGGGGGGGGDLAADFFTSDPFGSPAVPATRYQRNRSAMTSVNNIFRLADDLTLKVNADYAFDANDYDQARTTDYAVEDGRHIVVEEQAATAQRRQQAGLQLQWEKNADHCYLLDELNLQGTFARSLFRLGGGQTVRQRNADNSFSVGNRLEWTGRRGRKVRSVSANFSFAQTPLGYLRATDPAADTLHVRQDVEGLSARAAAATAIGLVIRQRDLLSVGFSFTGGFDRFESRQTCFSPTPDNRNDGYYVRAAVTPSYQLSRGAVSLKTSLAVVMHSLRYRDLTGHTHESYHRPFVSPRLEFFWRWYDFCGFTLNANYDRQPGTLADIIAHPVFTTYRDTRAMGDGTLTLTDQLTLSSRLSASLPTRGLNFAINGNYHLTHNDRLTSSSVSPDATGTTFVAGRNALHLMAGGAEVTKNCFDIYLYLKLRADVSALRTQMLRQDLHLRLRNRTYALTAQAEGGLLDSRITARLSATWQRSVQQTDGPLASRSHFDQAQALLRIGLFPWKKLECYASASFVANEMEAGRFRKDFYLDGGARLSLKRVELELSLRNLTNRRQYVLRNYVLSDVYSYVYRLRPAEGLLSVKYKF